MPIIKPSVDVSVTTLLIAGDTKLWTKYGNLHRLDGPAVIFHNGTLRWFINGVEYTEQEVRTRAFLSGVIYVGFDVCK